MIYCHRFTGELNTMGNINRINPCLKCLEKLKQTHRFLTMNRRKYTTGAKSDVKGQISSLKNGKNVWILNSSNIYENLAIEEWLYKYEDFKSRSLLLLWRNDPCVVIGRHQNPWVELDVTKALQYDVAVARRSSGGGTVYHDQGNMCISFFTARDKYNRETNLQLICDALVGNYSLDVSVNCRDDLLLQDKYKISGTAAKLGSKVAYHHCTLLLDVDKSRVTELLHSPMKGVDSNATESVSAEVKNLQEVNAEVTYEGVCHALTKQYYSNSQNQAAQYICDYENIFPGISQCKAELETWQWRFGKTPNFKISRKFSGLLGHIAMTLELDLSVEKGIIQHIELKLTGSECAMRTCQIFCDHLHGTRFWWNDIDDVIKHIHDNSDLFDQCDDRGYSWIAMCLNELFY